MNFEKTDIPVVAFGGGTALANLMYQAKDFYSNLIAIPSVFDNGGSTRDFRKRGHVALGDICNVMKSLADEDVLNGTLLGKLFNFRFKKNHSSKFDNTSMSNVILAALTEMIGGINTALPDAIEILGRELKLQGKVIPISLDQSHLESFPTDHHYRLHHEGQFDALKGSSICLTNVSLRPIAHIYKGADEAIRQAKKLWWSGGSWLMSVLAGPLVDGFNEAVNYAVDHGAETCIYTNLMTVETETPGFTSADFVKGLLDYVHLTKIDVAVCNQGSDISENILAKYREDGEELVRYEPSELARRNIPGPFASVKKGHVVHNKEAIRATLNL